MMQFEPGSKRFVRNQRRAVSSVLAMMFLVIFSSLAAAMAVVSQGNLRTADSSLKVSRAMSAAETGLHFARRRLQSSARRFVVTEGDIDVTFADSLWSGTYSGGVEVLPPDDFVEGAPPTSLLEALFNAHDAYGDLAFAPEPGDSSLPTMDESLGTLLAQPMRLSLLPRAPYFRLKYEILADTPAIRVTSQGVDGDVRRTLQMDFAIDKKIEFAVISPSRIMIGKNVRVEGPLGSRYGWNDATDTANPDELNTANGDPLVLRSDFYFLDPALDAKLDTLYEQIALHDADGDNRLRPYHPVESVGVDAAPAILVDYDGNEYIDDFDLFLRHYDANTDGRVTYGTGNEFTVDEQLAHLIDQARPDRDGDGDVDGSDTALGYDDGFIDAYDLYAKVQGRLSFAVDRAAWEATDAHNDTYQTVVQGPIIPDIEVAPVSFEVSTDEMREITTDMLVSVHPWFEAQANDNFGDYNDGTGAWTGQVAAQISAGGTYTPASDDTWESVPFGSQGAYDYYERQIFEDMTFTNVVIPKGTNAVFKNCWFVGVVYLETNEDCDQVDWNYTGAVKQEDDGLGGFVYPLRFPDLFVEIAGTQVFDTRPESNNIRFDSCTFIGSITGDTPLQYTHWRNKVQMTGTTRFYIDSSDPEIAEQADSARILAAIASLGADVVELEKSSILLPGWSVDVGTFDNQTEKVKLKGTIIAGILDARGTVDVFGTLMMTFRPVPGEGPLFYGGQTDAFNTTIGYFGPTDGDGEGADPAAGAFGEITLRYNPDAVLPDGIPWPIRIDPDPLTYREGGSL